MQTRFAQAFKNKNPFNLEGPETQALTEAANAVRLLLVERDLAKLLDKETVACLLATD